MADSESTETESERGEAADTGASPGEAHREGEFDDIINRLKDLSLAISTIQSALSDVLISRPANGSDADDNDEDDDSGLVDVDQLDV